MIFPLSHHSLPGKSAKLLRKAFELQLKLAADGRVVSRLLKEFVRVVKSDPINDRGLRDVLHGEIELLQHFDFNTNSHLSVTLKVPYVATIDRASGKAPISLPACLYARCAGSFTSR